VGKIDPQAKDLLDTTAESLNQGIAQARVGNELRDISKAVQAYIEDRGYFVVKRFVGHGIGRQLHEKPEVPNFVTKHMAHLPLKAGLALAIEPMVSLGTDEVEILDDKWTAVTKDRSLSAHFENTIAITQNGPEILSRL
jgi:methionyl aminopeptidase